MIVFQWIYRLIKAILSLVLTMVTLGLSLLPLTALLIALPAVSPNEAVLTQTVPPATSWFRRTMRRLMALTGGIAVLVALLASAVAIVDVLPLPKQGQLGSIGRKVLGYSIAEMIPEKPPEKPATPPPGSSTPTFGPPVSKLPDDPAELLALRDKNARIAYGMKGDPKQKREAIKDLDRINAKIEEMKPKSPYLQVMLDDQKKKWLGEPVWKLLPSTMVQHWPFVFLTVYGLDLILMLAIGRVPLAYNLRNLVVRWRITGLTALAFTVVVALLVALLAFVNGMYELNNGTGVPGNVIVLSEGSTDELFSNLGYGQKELRNVLTQYVTQDENGATLETPARVATMAGPDGRDVYLSSQETFFVMNQAVPTRPGETPRRRFLQMRAIRDPLVAAKVHQIGLYPGGQWFSSTGVEPGPDGTSYIQCVLGEGSAATLGEDEGKPRLEPGDTFRLGDMNWIVSGIMQSAGKTFGSEVWVSDVDLVTKPFGKNGKPTTIVLRAEPDTPEAAKAIAYHLQFRYDVIKLKAFQEQAYYAELTKTNETVPHLHRRGRRHHGHRRRLRRHEHHVRLDRRPNQGSRGPAHPRVQAVADPDLVHARIAAHLLPRRPPRLCHRLSRQLLRSQEHALRRRRGRREKRLAPPHGRLPDHRRRYAVHSRHGPAGRPRPGFVGASVEDSGFAKITQPRRVTERFISGGTAVRTALCLLLLASGTRLFATEPPIVAKPDAFQTLVNPQCSHCRGRSQTARRRPDGQRPRPLLDPRLLRRRVHPRSLLPRPAPRHFR